VSEAWGLEELGVRIGTNESDPTLANTVDPLNLITQILAGKADD